MLTSRLGSGQAPRSTEQLKVALETCSLTEQMGECPSVGASSGIAVV
jgi:hypothetical protein